jgi:ABC-2 type transport system permease protein
MTALQYTLTDSVTMLRRNLMHAVRYPLFLYMIGVPVVVLLLFVYAFGGTLGAGLPGGGDKTAYLTYVVPGIVFLAIGSGGQLSAISVSQDMTEGIIARFRTMDISRSAVMAGHVLGNTLQLFLATVVTIVLAVVIGFRATTGIEGWLGALGFILLVTYVLTWLCVAMGMQARSVESASNLPMPLTLLPFLASGFVPTESMPAGLQWFAEHQPFTPFIETLRAFLLDTPMGMNGWISLAWCAVIGLGGWAWARFLYERRSLRLT